MKLSNTAGRKQTKQTNKQTYRIQGPPPRRSRGNKIRKPIRVRNKLAIGKIRIGKDQRETETKKSNEIYRIFELGKNINQNLNIENSKNK